MGTGFDPVLPTYLQEADMKVGNNDAICQLYGFDLNLLYCVYDNSTKQAKSQVCSGDSGSPLFYKVDNKWFIYGVVSFTMVEQKATQSRCLTNTPSYFAQVPLFVDWITKKMQIM